MTTPIAKFPFTLLMEDDEPKRAGLINDHINSLMEVGRWPHMDEDTQRAMDTQVLNAVQEIFFCTVRNNFHLSYLEVALYDPSVDEAYVPLYQVEVKGIPAWIKLLSIKHPTHPAVKED